MEPDDAPWRRPDAAAPTEPGGGPTPDQPAPAVQRPEPRRRVEPARRFTAGEAVPARPAGERPANDASALPPRPPADPASAHSTPARATPAYSTSADSSLAYPGLVYQGPPRMQPPPAGWRPEYVVTPPPPRALPAQDHAGIDADEARAMALTRAVAITAGAILLLLMCAVCGRWIV